MEKSSLFSDKHKGVFSLEKRWNVADKHTNTQDELIIYFHLSYS